MKITSAIAIYFVIWWISLFIVLPFGVKNANEAGQSVPEGHEAGAPIDPQLKRKALITTIVATVVFGLIYLVITGGWISL